MSEKLSVNEIVERLRTLQPEGGPQQMAEAVGVENDKTLYRALKKLMFAGELIAGGSTRARFFIWASSEDIRMQAAEKVAVAALKRGETDLEGSPPEALEKAQEHLDEIDRELLSIIPCTAKTFSAKCHELGLEGRVVDKRKRDLKLLTMKQTGQSWMKDPEKTYWIVDHETSTNSTRRPERIAGGFGIAKELGFQGGKGEPGFKRTEVFGVMGPNAVKDRKHPIGSGKD